MTRAEVIDAASQLVDNFENARICEAFLTASAGRIGLAHAAFKMRRVRSSARAAVWLYARMLGIGEAGYEEAAAIARSILLEHDGAAVA